MNVFVDTNALIYIAKSARDQDGIKLLNAVFKNGDHVILTDAVVLEATQGDEDRYADVRDIRSWIKSNNIEYIPTSFGGTPGKDHGEKSIAEVLADPQYSGQPYLVISSDKASRWEKLGVDPDKVHGVVAYKRQS